MLLVDENDVLRDEGEAYGRKLAAAGVPVTSVRHNGTIHGFMLLNPIASTPNILGAVDQASGICARCSLRNDRDRRSASNEAALGLS